MENGIAKQRDFKLRGYVHCRCIIMRPNERFCFPKDRLDSLVRLLCSRDASSLAPPSKSPSFRIFSTSQFFIYRYILGDWLEINVISIIYEDRKKT